MVEQLTFTDLQPLVMKMSEDMNEKQGILGELDSQTGDGDIGVTVVLCFRTMVKVVKSFNNPSISGLLKEFSVQIGEVAPSTFGTLISTMLLGMSIELADVQVIGAIEFAKALQASGEAVMKRGGAKPGDKTLLDALIPAAEQAMKSAKAGNGLSECAEKTAAEAVAGAERSVMMEAKTGRAGYMGARTIGNKDAGAETIAMMLKSFNNYVKLTNPSKKI